MKKLLVVVDFQKDFVTGSLGFPGAAAIEDAICDKIRAYRKAGGDVIFTLDTHFEDYLETEEGRHLPVPHCLRGTDGWRLTDKVAALTGDSLCIEKETFGSLALAQHLEGQAYDVIELCGVVSNICVISNAILAKAAIPDAHIVVDAACIAGADPTLHEKSLDVMAGLHIEVTGRVEG